MRGSMFDEFRPQIEEWCDQGLTVNQMLALMPPGFNRNGLYQYIYNNGIRGGAVKRETEARNVCDQCEYCKVYTNQKGQCLPNNRICTLTWRMINASVCHCPTWCILK